MSEYRIAITRADGKPVHLKPGAQGERDLVASVLAAAAGKGVGVFRTQAQTLAAVEAALRDVLHDLKSEVVPQ